MPAVSRLIDAPAPEAWQLLASTAAWPSWGPTVTAVEPAAETVRRGLSGRVRTPLGLWLPFRVTACEPSRSWSWSVAGVPATTHSVLETPDGCRVAMSVALPAAGYLLVCRLALARLAAMLERGD